MSYLIQILLPLQDSHKKPFPGELYQQVQQELKDEFGGVTAYTRSPAEGQWASDGAVIQDDIVVYETMVPTLAREWWAQYRQQLEGRFGQEEIVIRSLAMQRL